MHSILNFHPFFTISVLLSSAAAWQTPTVLRPSPLQRPISFRRPSFRVSSRMSMTSTTLLDGVTKDIINPGTGAPGKFGDVATVEYKCTIVSDGTVFARSSGPQKVIVGDSGMVDGWEAALPTMRAGERSVIRIDNPSYGYGSVGVPPIIPPDAALELDVSVLAVEEGADLGTFGSSDPLKPRTPASIAAAYATRRELAALEEADAKGGIEGFIDKVKGFYFFGFFEGETGENPPWILQPSITFPLAFAAVGAAFYVLYIAGGITERGGQVTDELDDIILSSAAIGSNVLLALLDQ